MLLINIITILKNMICELGVSSTNLSIIDDFVHTVCLVKSNKSI